MGGMEEEGQACKVNNGGEREAYFVHSPRRKKGYLYPPRNMAVAGF
jgi:hypothetical protein